MTDAFLFHRTDLARDFAHNLLGEGPFPVRSGLFLAAPRRTGKSTFLREDLVPALKKRGVLPVYVDLWEDRERDPGDLIRGHLVNANERAKGWISGAIRQLKPKKVSLPGVVTIDLASPAAKDASLTEILATLADTARTDIAVIIDEAQHALTSKKGLDAMYALKAARDAFGQTTTSGDAARLILLFTGSDRDKLSQLVNLKSQPFFGAPLHEFPLLGADYCAAYAAWLNPRLAEAYRVTPDALFEAFAMLGHRPEWLQAVVQDALFGGETLRPVGDVARAYRARHREAQRADFLSQTPLEQALIRQVANQGAAFEPYSAETLRFLQDSTGNEIGTSQIQSAIKALRARNILWHAGRGLYALEDGEMAEWLRNEAPDAISG